jgi:hypothetical protein
MTGAATVRRWLRPRTWLLLGTVVVLVVAAVLLWQPVRQYTGVAPPPQVDQPLRPEPPATAGAVLGVAHNAGNNRATTQAALAHHAAVVEIDVVSVRGQPAAGRVQDWPWLAERVFRGPSLAEAWAYASAAPVVKLDLQQNDPRLVEQVASFVAAQPASRQVMVSTRDPAALAYLRPRLPHATLLFSTAFPDAVRRLRSDPALRADVDGVSAFEGLVTPAFVDWAHANHLLVIAWTVNDGPRLAQLLALGVDGITTQNLAVLDALAR